MKTCYYWLLTVLCITCIQQEKESFRYKRNTEVQNLIPHDYKRKNKLSLHKLKLSQIATRIIDYI